MQKLAIVPIRNERTTVRNILDHLKQLGFTVLCVCDGNTDGTNQIVEDWIRANPGHEAIIWDVSMGVGGALRMGFERVAELIRQQTVREDAVVCTIDSDGQHNPLDLQALVTVREHTGADVVQGIRARTSKRWLRRAGNRALSAFARLRTGIPFVDVECGMRCISARLVPRLLSLFQGCSYGVGQELAVVWKALGATVLNRFPIRPAHFCHRTAPRHFFLACCSGMRTRYRAWRKASLPPLRPRPMGLRRAGGIAEVRDYGFNPPLTLLVVPPTGSYIREDRCQAAVKRMFVPFFRQPNDLMSIAAAIESLGGGASVIEDYPVKNHGIAKLHDDVKTLRPNYLVISTTDFTIHRDLALAADCKRLVPDVMTIFKGPTFRDAAVSEDLCRRYPAADVVVRGDYATAIAKIISGHDPSEVQDVTYRNRLTQQISTVTAPSDTPQPLVFRRPARHLISNGLYRRADNGRPLATIEVSRGCGFQCSFCLAPHLWRSMSFKEPQEIVAELAEAHELYGLRDFFFLSDCFTLNRRWVLDLCSRLHQARIPIEWVCNSRIDGITDEVAAAMAQAGCRGIAMGIESGNQQTLDRIQKGARIDDVAQKLHILRNHALTTLGYFMIGFPWEDEKLIQQTIDFACSVELSLAEFNLPVPFPGTSFYEMYHKEGLLISDDLDGESYGSALVRTHHLDPQDLLQLRRRAYRAFYGRPRYLIRRAIDVSSPLVLARLSLYAISKQFSSQCWFAGARQGVRRPAMDLLEQDALVASQSP